MNQEAGGEFRHGNRGLSHPTSPGISNINEGAALRRVLGLPSLVLFGLAYMVPLAVFDTYGIVTQLTEGHLPTAYILTLAAMFFTAYSYGRMVEVIPVAGSAYSYSRHAFGGHVGFMVGWTLMLDYIFLPMLNYVLIGIYMSEYFPGVPASYWIIGTILLVTGLNILGIRVVARMNFIIIAFQAIFLVVFLTLFLTSLDRDGAASLIAPFYTDEMRIGSVVAGAAILCLSFLGFDAVSTLSEETRNPRRDIPRAIMLCTLSGGIIFVIAAWAGHVIFPEWQSFTDPDSAALDVMKRAGGAFMVSFFTAAYVSGTFASTMAAQASVSRILYAMGRDQVLPRGLFGIIHKRFGTPVRATVFVGIVSLLATVISLELVASMISFGALAAFSLVNLSVLKTYLIDQNKRQGTDLLRYAVLPGCGFLLTVWLWTGLSSLTFAVGLVWVGVGFLYLLYLTGFFTRPVPQLDLREE